MRGYGSISFLSLTLCAAIRGSAEDNTCEFPSIENGKIAQYYYNFKYYYFPMSQGKKITLSCLVDHTTAAGNQDEVLVCTERGWSPAPVCFKKCTKPLVDNGIVSLTKESYKIMEKTEYRCTAGYINRRGTYHEEIHCLSDGWSPQPSCSKKSETCEIPELHHGYFSTTQKKFKINEKLQFKCEDGYHTKTGNVVEEVECFSYGWSSLPQCKRFACAVLQSIQHGNFHPKKTSYSAGDVVQFSCSENYSLSGSELIQCYYFGWSPDPPLCEDKQNKCPPPPQIPHSIKEVIWRLYRNGDKFHHECEENYEIKDSPEIQCVGGAWTSPPSCVEIKEKRTCDQPPSVDNGRLITISEMYYSGDTVEYQCTHGYKMLGQMEIQCEQGKWRLPPKCSANTGECRDPPSIINGDIVEPIATSYPAGSSVEYSCHSYHLMEGSRTALCEQGMWSTAPVCLKPCTLQANEMIFSNIELLWNNEANLYSLHGDIIEFKCSEGFVLARNELKVQCLNGILKYPQCTRKGADGNCGPPPVIQNAVIQLPTTGYSNGSSVEYTCYDYHFLQGSRMIYCLNGQWTTAPTCIQPCSLSMEEIGKNKLELRWSFDNRKYFFHGEYVDFRCKPGFYNSGLTGVRIQCLLGQLDYPTCT